MVKRALLSVSDKNGVVDFAKRLDAKGIEILATEGTAKLLRDNDIDAIDVERFMGSQDVALGRDKTLHPKIHDALTPQKENGNRKKGSMPLINLVAVNLIPLNFEKSSDEGADPIDIGGATLIRHAAKNFKFVTVVTDPGDYESVMTEIEKNGDTKEETRRKLAEKAFETTALYDSQVAFSLSHGKSKMILVQKINDLNYGENPHQKGSFYRDADLDPRYACLANAKVLQGDRLTFNNILDGDAALSLVREFEEPCVAFVKHTNPCGVAMSKDLVEAFVDAYQDDPKAAYGGIIAMNRPCSADLAEAIVSKFFKLILAPDYEKKALEIFSKKPHLRLLSLGEIGHEKPGEVFRKVSGGLLIEDSDTKQIRESDVRTVTRKEPTEKQLKDLLFAWIVAKHAKSNAVVLAKQGRTVGIGAGQTSQWNSVDLAIHKATGQLKGSVLACDGSLSFADCFERAAKAGITAIIQPGGSMRDPEAIQAADKHGIAMVFTGFRAFLH